MEIGQYKKTEGTLAAYTGTIWGTIRRNRELYLSSGSRQKAAEQDAPITIGLRREGAEKMSKKLEKLFGKGPQAPEAVPEEGNQLSNSQRDMGGRPVENKKRLIYENFRKQNYSVRESAELAGYNASYARLLESKRKTGLLAPYVASAKKAVRDIVRGKKVGDSGAPRASDVLHAAEIVLDRQEPKVNVNKNMSLRINADLGPGDRVKYIEALKLAASLGAKDQVVEGEVEQSS